MGHGGGRTHRAAGNGLTIPPATTGAAYFAGRWRMDRVIRDHRTGQKHRFEGHAEFTSVSGSNGRSVYTEEGILVRQDQSIDVTRRYLYDWTDATHAHVRFEGGRLFHGLDLGTGSCQVGHECGMDRYDGRYEIRGPQAWDLAWRVIGPEKDYEILTGYQRLATNEPEARANPPSRRIV